VYALGAQMIAALVSVAAGGDLLENPVSPFLAVIVVTYAVGAYAPVGWDTFGLGVGVVGVFLLRLVGNEGNAGDYLATELLAVFGPWFAGRVAREWAQRALELQRVNAALKAEQDQRSLLAVADERARIARELHDVVAHSISVMVVQAEGAKRLMEKDPRRARGALEQIEGTGRAALVEMRRLLGVLRKDTDEGVRKTPQPGTQTLDVLVNRAQEAGLDVRVAIEGTRRTLPAGVDVSIYRIVQEALTNSLKHAGKTRADVLLTYDDNAIEVEVVDAGMANGHQPPTADPENPQHGLLGMKERVSLYGGEIVTGPCEDGRDGYRVWARIPLTS
jgi:signal transduction histidine kinase